MINKTIEMPNKSKPSGNMQVRGEDNSRSVTRKAIASDALACLDDDGAR